MKAPLIRVVSLVLAVGFGVAWCSTSVMAQCQEEWVDVPEFQNRPGPNALLGVFDDGSGDALYMTEVYSGNVGTVLKWDGVTLSDAGWGVNGGPFRCMAVFDDGTGAALYVGGNFTSIGGVNANRIAKWDGSNWSPLGLGTNASVTLVLASNEGGTPVLYVAGDFTTAGGESANQVARWDGTSWSALGTGLTGGLGMGIKTLAIFDDGSGEALYVGGSFSVAGGATANRVAKWDGDSWSAVGAGMNGIVNALEVFDDGSGPVLYAGGAFVTVQSDGAENLAKWDGVTWSRLPVDVSVFAGVHGPAVTALKTFYDHGGSALYAGGELYPGGGSQTHAAKWDGANWADLGSGRIANTSAVYDDGSGPALFTGGSLSDPDNGEIEKWQVSCLPTIGPNKSRFISLLPAWANPAEPRAIRVTLSALHHVQPPYTGGPSVPFTSFEGQVRWVGPPTLHDESTSSASRFYASSLQCTPHYRDWSTMGVLHITGSAVVPSSMYHVESLSYRCEGVENTLACLSGGIHVSVQQSIETARWGDAELPYSPQSATAQPDVGDIAALVNKFRSAPGAPSKARTLLAGDDAFGNFTTIHQDLGFNHIAACVDAFRGKPYPHTIQACP